MRDHSPQRVLSLFAALLGTLFLAGSAPAAQVTRFSPQGTVKQVRQASAAFSEPMVAFGDPAAADPFDVTCPVPGQGRWVEHGLELVDGHGRVVDRVSFDVRGMARLGAIEVNATLNPKEEPRP